MKKPVRIIIRVIVYSALFFCFFPYRSVSLEISNITGSQRSSEEWFFVFWTSATHESPLKKWSYEHHLVISEKYVTLIATDQSFFIHGNLGGESPRPAMNRFSDYLQSEYILKEDERTIQQFLVNMMAVQSEAEREKLVAVALGRVAEFTGIDPANF